ncbi:MAG: ribosomal subunit interface protein [Planctomycetota bacterium]|jgi:ribosomal subunit interface protein
MKTEVAILHHEYPSRIRQHIADKLENLTRFFDGTVSVRAVLERVHNEHRVELISNVRRGVVLRVDARGDSITSAADDAVGKMGRVLARYKDKLKLGNRRRPRE